MLGYDLWKLAEHTGTNESSPPLSMSSSSEDKGVIPRSMEYIFDSVSNVAKNKAVNTRVNADFTKSMTITQKQFVVSVSYVEIYNEKLIDLLNCDSGSESDGSQLASSTFVPQSENINAKKPVLDIRTGKDGEITVPGLTILEVQSVDEVMECLWIGAQKRSVASTNMNDYSSRSHTILILYLRLKEMSLVTTSPIVGDKGGTEHSQSQASTSSSSVVFKKSKICFVDLAGSEKWRSVDMSNVSGDRIKELTSINKSLSALGNCISALMTSSKGSYNGNHIPYRDSKLTRLVQDSLGGNAKTVFIVTLAAGKSSAEETHSTLQFADRAMKVQIYAKQNIVSSCVQDGGVGSGSGQRDLILQLQAQIRELEDKTKDAELKYSMEVDRLREMLQLLLCKLIKSGGTGSTSGLCQSMLNEVNNYPQQVHMDQTAKSIPVSFLQQLAALQLENKEMKRTIHTAQSQCADSQAELKRVLGIVYKNPSSLHDQGGEDDLELKMSYLKTYHLWLRKQIGQDIPDISETETENPIKVDIIQEEGPKLHDGMVVSEELMQRINMMEASVLLQAKELERAKALFIQLNADKRSCLQAPEDFFPSDVVAEGNEMMVEPRSAPQTPAFVRVRAPPLTNPNPKSRIPMLNKTKRNASRGHIIVESVECFNSDMESDCLVGSSLDNSIVESSCQNDADSPLMTSSFIKGVNDNSALGEGLQQDLLDLLGVDSVDERDNSRDEGIVSHTIASSPSDMLGQKPTTVSSGIHSGKVVKKNSLNIGGKSCLAGPLRVTSTSSTSSPGKKTNPRVKPAHSAAKKKQSTSNYLKSDFASLVASTRNAIKESVAVAGSANGSLFRTECNANALPKKYCNDSTSSASTATALGVMGSSCSGGKESPRQHSYGAALESSLGECAALFHSESSLRPYTVRESEAARHDHDGSSTSNPLGGIGDKMCDRAKSYPELGQDVVGESVEESDVEDILMGDANSTRLVELANKIFDKQHVKFANVADPAEVPQPSSAGSIAPQQLAPKKKKKVLWKTFTDAGSGKCYYYNRATKETTWRKPSDLELLMEY